MHRLQLMHVQMPLLMLLLLQPAEMGMVRFLCLHHSQQLPKPPQQVSIERSNIAEPF